MQNRNEVGTLKKGLDILQLLLEHNDLSIQEIIGYLKLNQSTTYRLVNTLELNNFIIRNNQNKYELSDSLVSKVLKRNQNSNFDLQWRSVPFMDELSKNTCETIYIGMLFGTEIIITQAVIGKYATRTHLEVGDRTTIHADAIGKCILAFLDKEEQKRMIGNLSLTKKTEKTITSTELFQEELNRIKSNGYSIDDEEDEIGVRCVGAPIYKGEQVIAAIALSGPSVRISKEKDPEHVSMVKACAEAISKSL